MILVRNVKTPLGQPESEAVTAACRKLGVSVTEVEDAYVTKTSVDARKRGHIFKVSTVVVHLSQDEEQTAKKAGGDAQFKESVPFMVEKGIESLRTPVVIAGFGPAGMFAAELLAREGYSPIVVERGCDVDRRVKEVEGFWTTGRLNPACNVQFGEGGAGTFSDGKLTTRINDPLCDYVLERLAQHGAPKETLKKAKPHIGTDKLREVVKSIREEIIAKGGQVLFQSQLTGLSIQNGRLKGVFVNGGPVETEHLILAVGHSARDTFRMLAECGVKLESKAFSVGARIEHLQSDIDRGLYGDLAGHPDLPPGEYQLSHRQGNRAVYTFCMCPGGLVVPSASDEGQVVTNGMSEYARDGKNANSALVVSVDSNDFGSGMFAGMEFQRNLEERAFALAGGSYRACGATVGDFFREEKGLHFKRVAPTYSLGLTAVDFDQLFPKEITGMMRLGLQVFDRKIRGFGAADAVLTGPETRTSSPIRIPRGENGESDGIEGLYPCGEGAGYAGGIMSAAVDGVKTALHIIRRYAPR